MNLPGYDRWLDAPFQNDMAARVDLPDEREPDDSDDDEPDPDCCVLCHAQAMHNRAGDAIQVSPCMRCGLPVCGSCADVDCDCGGDPAEFFITDWSCPAGKGCREAVA